MTNNHYNEPAFPDGNNSGLTKLEYAAIHIYAGLASDPNITTIDYKNVVEKAFHLLTELKKESNEKI